MRRIIRLIMVKIKSEIFNGNICISLFLITLLVMSVLCSFTMTTIAGEVFELAMQDYMATSTLYYQTSEELCDLVKEMSNGRLIINLYAPGTIVPAYEITKAVSTGGLDLGITCAGMDAGVLGMSSFLVSQCNVPAGQGPMEAMAWYNVGDGLKYANKVWNTKFDVEVLGSLCNAPAELLYHSNVKIKEIEDFKGIK